MEHGGSAGSSRRVRRGMSKTPRREGGRPCVESPSPCAQARAWARARASHVKYPRLPIENKPLPTALQPGLPSRAVEGRWPDSRGKAGPGEEGPGERQPRVAPAGLHCSLVIAHKVLSRGLAELIASCLRMADLSANGAGWSENWTGCNLPFLSALIGSGAFLINGDRDRRWPGIRPPSSST